MKRFDPAVRARCSRSSPSRRAELQYISVVVNDPEFEPYFGPGEIVRGTDVPRELIESTRRGEAEQVEAAVGSGDPDVVRAFSESFLGSLLHDLNAVHGLLEAMGEPLPGEVVAGDWWNEGRAVSGSVRLANGARWDSAWIQLLATHEYRESISFFFADSVRTLTFPSPWLKQSPTIYRRSERRNGAQRHPHRRVVRGSVRPRTDALPRLHRRRRAVPHTARAGASRHRRADADVHRIPVMRAGIVGAGFIAHVHAGALRAIGVEVAAVCGSTQQKAAAFGHGAAPYDDLGELLDREQVDVLHVCTPNDVHAEQALAALDRGVHVVCEKPLAVSTEESGRVVAGRRTGAIGATCYHVRGYPLVEEMRVAASSGELGRITSVHGRYLCDDVLFPASGWRQDPARSGPSYVVGDLGTHWLDLAEHVTGLQVTQVLAEFGHTPVARSRTRRACCCASKAAARVRSFSRPGPPAARISCCSSAREAMRGSPGTRRRRP